MSVSDRVCVGVGLLAHLALGVVPYMGSGLVAPAWGVALLGVCWVMLFALLLILARTHPRRTLLIPPAALLLWIGVVSFGGAFLGWTA